MNKKELEDLGYKATIEMIDGEKYIKISSTRPRRESNIKEIFDELDVWLWFESNLPKEVEMEENNIEVTDPLGTDWHKCPNCNNIVIATADRFCSSCGSKIKWVGK